MKQLIRESEQLAKRLEVDIHIVCIKDIFIIASDSFVQSHHLTPIRTAEPSGLSYSPGR